MAIGQIPPWLNIDPLAAVGRYLEGYRTGLSASEAESSANQRAQQLALAQQQAADLAAYRQAQMEQESAQFNAKLRLQQQEAEREAAAAASQLEGMRGIQADLEGGADYAKALAKWAPKLFAGQPMALARAMESVAPPRPPIFGQTPQGVPYMQSPGGGLQLIPPSYTRERQPVTFGTTPEGYPYWQDAQGNLHPYGISQATPGKLTDVQRADLRVIDSTLKNLNEALSPFLGREQALKAANPDDLKESEKMVRAQFLQRDKLQKERSKITGSETGVGGTTELTDEQKREVLRQAQEKIQRIQQNIPPGPAQRSAIQAVIQKLQSYGISLPNAPTAGAPAGAAPQGSGIPRFGW